ncbi:NAD(P)-binding protein [Trichoderma austrokoningii]
MASQTQISDLFGVKGLVAVITGGGTGIGLMIAQALEANGAIVYIIGRRLETLESAAKTAIHGNIIPIQGDITSKESLVSAAAQIKDRHGYINVLIPNAGINGPGLSGLPPKASLAQLSSHLMSWSTESFNECLDINMTGTFFTVAAFLELLGEGNNHGNLKQKSQVIITSSVSGFSRSSASGFAYSGSKAAMVHISKQLSSCLVPYDIRVNVIAPGMYPSDLTTGVIKQLDAADWPREIIPARRAGDAEDVAGAFLFLISRAGSYINGNVLVTDGGRLAVVPASY